MDFVGKLGICVTVCFERLLRHVDGIDTHTGSIDLGRSDGFEPVGICRCRVSSCREKCMVADLLDIGGDDDAISEHV